MKMSCNKGGGSGNGWQLDRLRRVRSLKTRPGPEPRSMLVKEMCNCHLDRQAQLMNAQSRARRPGRLRKEDMPNTLLQHHYLSTTAELSILPRHIDDGLQFCLYLDVAGQAHEMQ
jgi:hypothetical protein